MGTANRRRRELHSLGLLCRVQWWFITDVSGKPFGPIFNWTDFYWFILCSDLLISSLFQFAPSFTPQLNSGVSRLSTRYFYHGVELDYDFLPNFLFCLYLFINHTLRFISFLSVSSFPHAYVLLCLANAPVRISSFTEGLSPNLRCQAVRLPLPPNY